MDLTAACCSGLGSLLNIPTSISSFHHLIPYPKCFRLHTNFNNLPHSSISGLLPLPIFNISLNCHQHAKVSCIFQYFSFCLKYIHTHTHIQLIHFSAMCLVHHFPLLTLIYVGGEGSMRNCFKHDKCYYTCFVVKLTN
jgi:hypothetical protein